MKWYDIRLKRPKDDQNVFVLNENFPDTMFHKAYYEEKTEGFFSLESHHSFPLAVTHWAEFPSDK